MGGTVNGVVQSPSVFNFMNGFLMFDLYFPPNMDAEFCILFDPSVSFDASNAISKKGYDVKVAGGTSTVDTRE